MRAEARRWLRQAEADLRAAKVSPKNKCFEWACFQSQQCAEKALKAFLYGRGLRSIVSHSVKLLLARCVKFEPEFKVHDEDTRLLDAFYIPIRYPQRTG